jgi:hypothetical protein
MGVRLKITAVAACSILAATGLPASAGAEPGLTVDPQSPAGVEYAVPLDHARGGHGGSGGSGGSGTGGGSPALFGNGIKAAGGSGSGSGSGSGNGHDTGSGNGAGGNSGGGKTQAPSGTERDVTPVAASASYSTAGPIAGLAGAVLLAGGGLGLFLRLRSRRSSPGSP